MFVEMWKTLSVSGFTTLRTKATAEVTVCIYSKSSNDFGFTSRAVAIRNKTTRLTAYTDVLSKWDIVESARPLRSASSACDSPAFFLINCTRNPILRKKSRSFCDKFSALTGIFLTPNNSTNIGVAFQGDYVV